MQGAEFQNILIGWDGGARAARAVGDAMSLLARAELVEIGVRRHRMLQRASPAPVWQLTLRGVARDATDHRPSNAARRRLQEPSPSCDVDARANLLVMGAYAHPKVLQIVLGGVTSGVLSEAELPVLLSY